MNAVRSPLQKSLVVVNVAIMMTPKVTKNPTPIHHFLVFPCPDCLAVTLHSPSAAAGICPWMTWRIANQARIGLPNPALTWKVTQTESPARDLVNRDVDDMQWLRLLPCRPAKLSHFRYIGVG